MLISEIESWIKENHLKYRHQDTWELDEYNLYSDLKKEGCVLPLNSLNGDNIHQICFDLEQSLYPNILSLTFLSLEKSNYLYKFFYNKEKYSAPEIPSNFSLLEKLICRMNLGSSFYWAGYFPYFYAQCLVAAELLNAKLYLKRYSQATKLPILQEYNYYGMIKEYKKKGYLSLALEMEILLK